MIRKQKKFYLYHANLAIRYNIFMKRGILPYWLISAVLHIAILTPLMFAPWFGQITQDYTPTEIFFKPETETVAYTVEADKIPVPKPSANEVVTHTPEEIPYIVLVKPVVITEEEPVELKPQPDPEPLASPPSEPPAVASTQAKPLDEGVNKKPVYPALAQHLGQEGLVVLMVEVDEQGLVSDITIGKSSGHKILDDAAVRAVKKWKFTPATREGTPVKSKIEIPIRFKLN